MGVGDAATWVASLLTGASLILGFSILRMDRKKEERQQAMQIAVWKGPIRLNGAQRSCQYTAWNNSAAVIIDPALILRPLPRKDLERLRSELEASGVALRPEDYPSVLPEDPVHGYFQQAAGPDSIPTLNPGEKGVFPVEFSFSPSNYSPLLQFRDAAGVQWERNIDTNELKKLEPTAT